MERTLILFKPDAVQRRLCGRLLARLEDKGLKIIGLKFLRVSKELSAKHYAEHVNKPFYPLLEEFITSGPVLALVAEGPQAVAVVRGMMGPTNGAQAAPGTIRGDYGVSRQMNLMHGSDSVEAARKEIGVYFKPDELVEYTTTLGGWVCAADEAN
jgi:nucleoside-diphosphate kinase